jgi:hypothetical protein
VVLTRNWEPRTGNPLKEILSKRIVIDINILLFKRVLKAVIYDFNGVILNDEPNQYRSIGDVVAEFGIVLTRDPM